MFPFLCYIMLYPACGFLDWSDVLLGSWYSWSGPSVCNSIHVDVFVLILPDSVDTMLTAPP